MRAHTVEGKKFRSARATARHYLTARKFKGWTQTRIARRLGVTVPCVNQVATELRS